MDFQGFNMNTDTQALNSEQHGHLKKISTHHFSHIKTEQLVPINIHEFPAAGICFPLFFIKDKKSAQLFPIALFGLIAKQNLYYSPQGWQASYVPLAMQSWPFSMKVTDPEKKQWQVAADINSAYLSDTEGEPLFTQGKPSELLSTITKVLISDAQQKSATVKFIDFLMQQDLIKAIKFEFGFSNGEKQQVDGVYAIDEDVLQNLKPEQVQEMYQKDYFKAIYCMLSSQHNLYELIKRSQANKGDKAIISVDIISG